jgi:pimeloyl-ACP methyl ester carboxylesterase
LVSSGGYGKKVGWKLRYLSLPIIGELVVNHCLTLKTLGFAVRASAYNKKAISEEFIKRYYAIINDKASKKNILKITREYINIFGAKSSVLNFIANNAAAIKNNTLVIWGKNDNLVPTAQAQTALSKIKNSQLHLFDNCGHIPQMEQQEKFNALILDFLAGAGDGNRTHAISLGS